MCCYSQCIWYIQRVWLQKNYRIWFSDALVRICNPSNQPSHIETQHMSYISIMISKIYLFASLLLSWFILSFSIPDAIHSNHKDPMTVALSILIILMAAGLWDSGPCTKSIQPGNRGTPIKRCHRSVDSIMYELGGYSRRYYRMENDTFWKLHGLLHQKIDNPSGETKEKRGGPPNGTIPSSIRLSCALRYFAGGDALDLAVVHGISHSEV